MNYLQAILLQYALCAFVHAKEEESRIINFDRVNATYNLAIEAFALRGLNDLQGVLRDPFNSDEKKCFRGSDSLYRATTFGGLLYFAKTRKPAMTLDIQELLHGRIAFGDHQHFILDSKNFEETSRNLDTFFSSAFSIDKKSTAPNELRALQLSLSLYLKVLSM